MNDCSFIANYRALTYITNMMEAEAVCVGRFCRKRRQWSECGFAASEEALVECRSA